MEAGTSLVLARDCEVVQIPSGEKTTLENGQEVSMVQSLGGTYTVRDSLGRLFRISGSDADAIGVEASAGDAPEASDGPVTEEAIWASLKTVYDPEIPVNIVDLGLVYDLNLETTESGAMAAHVKMTLTAPGCGMGTVIAGDAQTKLEALPGMERALVEIVWDPPWHQSMITADGRKILGL